MSRTLCAAFIVWFLTYALLRKARAWLSAYIVGAVGFSLLVVYAARGTWFERSVEYSAAAFSHFAANLLGIPTKIFSNAPGTLLVLVVRQPVGWTAVEIDIECSGLLEYTVFAGLVLFFEGFSWKYRFLVLPLGIAATFVMNVVRVTIIVAIIHFGGKNAIYLAHTVIGRLVFFLMVMVLYWYVFTRTSLCKVRETLREE